jgi:hypothetical protein
MTRPAEQDKLVVKRFKQLMLEQGVPFVPPICPPEHSQPYTSSTFCISAVHH